MVSFCGNEEAEEVLWGQCTDSGGGGTGTSFSSAMRDEKLTVSSDQYLTSFCTLHCLQLTISTPIKTILGDGGMISQGVFRTTAMQLLHGVYNLQANHERKEWAEMWSVSVHSLNNDERLTATQTITPPTIPCPILTRWWTVGVAATFLLEHWDIIGAVAQGVINKFTTVKKANQIASGVQTLMSEPVIISDVHLIGAFHEYFLFPHFAWLQKGDTQNGGTPGFLARHMITSYYLMHSDLTKGETSWDTLPSTKERV